MIIAIDFDGTCVTHEYPLIGDELPLCVDTLKGIVDKGHSLFLWTMRDNRPLAEAVRWFEERKIPLIGINKNPQWGTESPKEYAHIYIDDSALGCPLIHPGDGKRPYVDWKGVRDELMLKGIIL